MKRITALILVLILVFAVCSCGKTVPPDVTTENPAGTTGENPPKTTGEHTIKYSKGRETASGRAPATQTAKAGDTVEISKNTFSEYEMCFVEWTDGETTYQQGEIIEMPDRDLELTAVWEKGGSTMLIDDCKSNKGWWGTYSITHGSDEDGRQWNGTSGNDVLIFCNVYDTPINISRFEKEGYLHLTLWVENVDMLVTNTPTNGMFEFYDQDGEVTSWSVTDAGLKTGWNDIAIRLYESHTDKADLTNISSFRLFQYVTGQTEIRIGMHELWMPDNTKVINFLGGGADYLMGENREMSIIVAIGSEISLPKNLWVRDGYDFAGWTDGDRTYQEGDKYLVTKDSMSLKAKWKAKETKVLKYDYSYKTEDYDSYDGERIVLPADAVKSGYSFTGWKINGKQYPPGSTYIMGSGDTEAKAVFSEIADYGLISGSLGAWELNGGGSAGYAPSAIGGVELESKWTVWLNSDTFGRVADFSTSGSYLYAKNTGIDLGSSFTVSAFVNAPVRENQNRVIISQSGGSSERKTDEIKLFNADDNTGWWGMGPINIGSEAGPKEGKAYLEATEDDLVVFCCTPEVNLSKYVDNNGSLRLWVYIDNAANLDTARGGAVDLASDGGQGAQSSTWTVTDLKDGWNEIIIPLGSARAKNAKMKAINYFRFYHYLLDETLIGIDAMYVFSESVSTEGGWSLYADGKTGQLGFAMDGLSGIQLSGKNIVDGRWHQVGVSYENGTLVYYVDTEAVKTLTVGGTPNRSADDIYIGNSPAGDNNFDGSVAQVRLFGAALPADKVTTTVIKESDNASKSPVLNVGKGIVMERFQGANLSRNSYEVYNPNKEIHGVTLSNITAAKKLGFDHVKITVTPNNMIDGEGHLIKENAIYMTEDVDAILK
ncbi:MAG: InlB B-repeat-containing protein, partial [Clostridia bacterium]|nr:InlB B-repeat-containing protein [Clostridia bacterium]